MSKNIKVQIEVPKENLQILKELWQTKFNGDAVQKTLDTFAQAQKRKKDGRFTNWVKYRQADLGSGVRIVPKELHTLIVAKSNQGMSNAEIAKWLYDNHSYRVTAAAIYRIIRQWKGD